jgi:hypothetical protein
MKSFKGRFIPKMRLKDKRFSLKLGMNPCDRSCLDHLAKKVVADLRAQGQKI